MHWDLAGGDGGFLKHGRAVGIVLRDAIGLGQRDEALGIGRDLIEQLVLQQVALALQGEDLSLDIGILLLADGQGADMLPSAVPSAATRAAAPPPPGAGSLEARTVTNSRQDFVVISIRIFSFEFVRGLNRPLMGAPAAYCARGPGGDWQQRSGSAAADAIGAYRFTPACPYRRHSRGGRESGKNSGGDSAEFMEI